MNKECLRCGQDANLSELGSYLINFVCDNCRTNTSGWDFNGTRLEEMEHQAPGLKFEELNHVDN